MNAEPTAGTTAALEGVAGRAKERFAAGACSIAVLDEAAGELVYLVAVGGGGAAFVGTRLPVGHGIAGWAVTSGQPISVTDVAADPRFARDVAEASGYVPTTITAMPLVRDGDVVGVLQVLDPGTDVPVEELAALAAEASAALAGDPAANGDDVEKVAAALRALPADVRSRVLRVVDELVALVTRR